MTEYRYPLRTKLIPFILTLFIVIADQITKNLIVAKIPMYGIGFSSGEGEFLRIIHVQNKAVAFSLGHSLPDQVRMVLFIVIPVIIIAGMIFYILKSKDFTLFQRWAIASIIGGGIGNLIDRIFRPNGVVDFIDVKFYGIFGLERWPTFNVADSGIVVGGILLILSLIIMMRREHEQES